jgi:ABC-2 type transport system permease protein
VSPRLFAQIFSLQARRIFSYRAEFWVNTAAGFGIQFLAIYCLWEAMFRESGQTEISGYTFDGMLLYYVAAILLGKLVRGRERESDLAGEIYEGGYTRYIIYPVRFFAYKYAQHLGGLIPAAVQVLLFGAAAGFVVAEGALEAIAPAGILMAGAAVALGNLLHFLLKAPVQGVAFWADNVWSLDVMTRFIINILGGALLPLDLYPEWAQRILHWLPFEYLTFFPVRALLGQVRATEFVGGMAIAAGWCLLLAMLTRTVWRRGDRQYTGVGI